MTVAMLFSGLMGACGDKEQVINVAEQLRDVERLELASMTVSKVGVIKDPGFGESEGLAGKAQALFDGIKIGKRIGVYSYNTYLNAYIDLSELLPEDVVVDASSHTASIVLPPVRIMVEGRDPELHEEHLRVTGLRSRITPEERAALKGRMAAEVSRELRADKSVETALRSSAEAKARMWITELMSNWGYNATVTFRK